MPSVNQHTETPSLFIFPPPLPVSFLFLQRMTVRFEKRKGAILLGELSGRLSLQGGVTTAVCSVRPLSLATDEIVGKVRLNNIFYFLQVPYFSLPVVCL